MICLANGKAASEWNLGQIKTVKQQFNCKILTGRLVKPVYSAVRLNKVTDLLVRPAVARLTAPSGSVRQAVDPITYLRLFQIISALSWLSGKTQQARVQSPEYMQLLFTKVNNRKWNMELGNILGVCAPIDKRLPQHVEISLP